MLSEEDKEEQEKYGRIKCQNCYYFSKGSESCFQGDIRTYKVCEPERYRRCENYKEIYETRRNAEEKLAEIRKKLI